PNYSLALFPAGGFAAAVNGAVTASGDRFSVDVYRFTSDGRADAEFGQEGHVTVLVPVGDSELGPAFAAGASVARTGLGPEGQVIVAVGWVESDGDLNQTSGCNVFQLG